MKKYEKPELQVIKVLVSDVLTASTDGLTNGGTGTASMMMSILAIYFNRRY